MAEREKAPRKEPTKKAEESGAKRPVQEVSISFVQELFSWIKLRRLMEDEVPGSVNLPKLKEIEQKLASSDQGLKSEATTKLQELLGVKERVATKSSEIGTAKRLLESAKVGDDKKIELKKTAEDIDRVFAKAKKEKISNEELQRVNGELQEMALGLGIKESSQGLEEVMAKMQWLEASQEARQFVTEPDLYTSPVKEYGKEFVEGKEGEVLKLRDVPRKQKEKLQNRLDIFKKQVTEDLVKADPVRLEKLRPEEVMARLKETTYWQANIKHLQGSRKWVGSKNLEQLREMLGRVEAQYQALLEEKMVKGIGKKYASKNLDKNLIRESFTQALRGKRRFLRTEYDFERNVRKGKSPVETLESEVAGGAEKMQIESSKRAKTAERERIREHAAGASSPEDGLTDEQSKELFGATKKLQETQNILKRIGVTDEEMEMGVRSPEIREQWYKRAEQAKLSTDEMRTLRSVLLSEAAIGRAGMKSDEQMALERLRDSGDHNKFLIKFKAYVERVGLREVSSDWDFAIMMRKAKEQIGYFNPDAGEKLDQWQEALFAPGIITLDEKTFFDVQAKIMSQSRLQHELGETYANWEAMQVTGADGSKKVVSVAAFHELLQRPDVGRRILNGPVNGNDSMIQQVLAEYIWGENAVFHADLLSAKEGKPPKMWVTFTDSDKRIDNVNVNYFSMDGKNTIDPKQSEDLSMEEFIDQSMWMTHYARTIWHYSGEWEALLRDFPEDQLTEANKRLLNIGAGFRDYGLDYGKFDVGYEALAKAGVLLQDFRTYKASNVLVANMKHRYYDEHIASSKRGEEIGKGLWSLVQKRAFIDDEYRPVVGMRTVDEIRLMGNLPSSEEEAWNWFKKNQEKMGRKGVLGFEQIRVLRGKNFESLDPVEEAWVVQADELNKWMDDLRARREEFDKLGLTKEELAPLVRKQSLLTTGEYHPNGVSLDEFLRNFEYSSIIDHAELKKGSDPLDYKNYSNAKMEAAKLMSEVLSGSPTTENIDQLYNTMKGYMPPEQLMAWFKAYTKRRVQLRTTQLTKYEIAMTDLEWWKMQRDKGFLKDKDGKTIYPEDPPETMLGINPAQYKIKDERGDSWNVIGADGFKVTKKKDEWGNHMWKTRRLPGLTASDVETQMKLYVGNRWLPNIESGNEILESSFGLGQMIDKFYKSRGISSKDQPKFAKFVKKYGSKLIRIIRKHPLFDDPQWAFWSILNELWEFTKGTGKEVAKPVVG